VHGCNSTFFQTKCLRAARVPGIICDMGWFLQTAREGRGTWSLELYFLGRDSGGTRPARGKSGTDGTFPISRGEFDGFQRLKPS
jgi:hypothetical protein